MDGMNKEKWLAMTPQQKREHIWEYYKLPIVGGIITLLVLGWLLHGWLTYREPVLDVIVTNSQEYLEQEMFHEFLEEKGYEIYKGAVVIQQNMMFDRDNPEMMETNYNSMNTLNALLSSATQDILFTNADIFGACAVQGALMDLRQILTEEMFETYESLILYVQDEDTLEEYPCGIKVDGNPWVQEHIKDYKGYVGIPRYADDVQQAKEFLLYLLAQEGA